MIKVIVNMGKDEGLPICHMNSGNSMPEMECSIWGGRSPSNNAVPMKLADNPTKITEALIQLSNNNIDESIRILLAGDNEYSREELKQKLSGDERVVIVGMTTTGKEILSTAKRLMPDVILIITDPDTPD